ncbi:PREDICTED: uncharacterized protein LOC108769863 [Trachymyrmex cornetzi]|uniref:uncharacterized protein LOC108769863 n=1 Tax=Trachymyrmex cornetzi TaxID=471704 RepID=UPI00084EE7EE|nr:PREDICTED: uncharacterized protein LOC108769863 [Trachymyrmex cornetzi]
MILASGKDWEEVTLATNAVIHRISNLGLEVAPTKTEVVGFHDKGKPANTVLRVAGMDIRVGSSMKYLGLMLDSRWTFEAHFIELVPRLERSALNLSRLLPNLGGPNNKRRMTGRLIRAYKTTSLVVNTALAGMPPFELEAKRQEEVYERISEIRKITPTNTPIPKYIIDSIKEESKKKMIRNWRLWIRNTEQGEDAIAGAIEE